MYKLFVTSRELRAWTIRRQSEVRNFAIFSFENILQRRRGIQQQTPKATSGLSDICNSVFLLSRYIKHFNIKFRRTASKKVKTRPSNYTDSFRRDKLDDEESWFATRRWNRGSIFQPGIISHRAWNRTITRVTRLGQLITTNGQIPSASTMLVKNDHGDCCKPAGSVCQHVNWIIKYSEVIHAIHCARSFCRDDPLERGMHAGNANTRYPGRSAIEMSIALARD